MEIIRKFEDGSYDPLGQREAFLKLVGDGHICATPQIDLSDNKAFKPVADGDIAIGVQCMFTIRADTVLTLEDQQNIIDGNGDAISSIRAELLGMALEGLEFQFGLFSIVDSPIPQLIGSVPMEGEDSEKENS